ILLLLTPTPRLLHTGADLEHQEDDRHSDHEDAQIGISAERNHTRVTDTRTSPHDFASRSQERLARWSPRSRTRSLVLWRLEARHGFRTVFTQENSLLRVSYTGNWRWRETDPRPQLTQAMLMK